MILTQWSVCTQGVLDPSDAKSCTQGLAGFTLFLRYFIPYLRYPTNPKVPKTSYSPSAKVFEFCNISSWFFFPFKEKYLKTTLN